LTDADTYGLTLEEIAKLTVRQIYFLYYSERNKEGKRVKLPYYFISEDQKRKNRMEQFRQFGKSMGKTDEEIEAILQKAIENGTI
jgi:ribosomal protein L22